MISGILLWTEHSQINKKHYLSIHLFTCECVCKWINMKKMVFIRRFYLYLNKFLTIKISVFEFNHHQGIQYLMLYILNCGYLFGGNKKNERAFNILLYIYIYIYIYILYIYIYIYIYRHRENKLGIRIICCPVSWGCRIHWLHLCRGVRPPP